MSAAARICTKVIGGADACWRRGGHERGCNSAPSASEEETRNSAGCGDDPDTNPHRVLRQSLEKAARFYIMSHLHTVRLREKTKGGGAKNGGG